MENPYGYETTTSSPTRERPSLADTSLNVSFRLPPAAASPRPNRRVSLPPPRGLSTGSLHGRRRSAIMVPHHHNSSPNMRFGLEEEDEEDDSFAEDDSSLRTGYRTFNSMNLSHSLGLSVADSLEIGNFVKAQRLKEWIKMFRRSDPRHQILNFFNDVAQEGASNRMDESFDESSRSILRISPLLRAFYRGSVFTVWRPTSFDAIRRMMLGEGVGKGLDIKGKSAKRGKLSGFVPFLQIHEEGHKRDIRTLSKTSSMRIFFHTEEYRRVVAENLRTVSEEMMDRVRPAIEFLGDEEACAKDEAKFEWACESRLWDMDDPTVTFIDDYTGTQGKWGIEVGERLFWKGTVIGSEAYGMLAILRLLFHLRFFYEIRNTLSRQHHFFPIVDLDLSN
jgi:hypothetical protein